MVIYPVKTTEIDVWFANNQISHKVDAISEEN
jgi:hypothetical protein